MQEDLVARFKTTLSWEQSSIPLLLTEGFICNGLNKVHFDQDDEGSYRYWQCIAS